MYCTSNEENGSTVIKVAVYWLYIAWDNGERREEVLVYLITACTTYCKLVYHYTSYSYILTTSRYSRDSILTNKNENTGAITGGRTRTVVRSTGCSAYQPPTNTAVAT